MFRKSPDLPGSHLLRVAVVTIALTILFVDGFDAVPAINPNVSAASPFFATCSPPCLEKFDSVTRPALPAGWTSTIATPFPALDLPWQTVNTSSVSSPNSVFARGPDRNTDNRLVSGTFATISTPATLSFMRRNELEPNFDGVVLEISIDGGPFIDIESAGGAFTSGPYNATINALSTSSLAGRRAWSGNSSGFVATSVNLPASVNGRNVAFRWRLVTDFSISSNGVFLDNIALTERPPNDSFANAQPILGASGVINGSNALATKESGEPNHAEHPGGSSVWYRWQAPSTGRFVFSTFGSDGTIDTLLAVYTGNTGFGTNKAFNDDELGCDLSFSRPRYSRVGFDAVGGVVYHIAVDTKSEDGNITLRWARAANITGRISDVSGRPAATSDDSLGAMDDVKLQGDGACRRSEVTFSVVFRDVAIGGNYTITVTGNKGSFVPWDSNPSISPLTGNVSSFNFYKIFPAYSIKGTVTGTNVNELAVVCVSIPNGQSASAPVNFVITKPADILADGSYTCSSLPEGGDYVVTPSKPGVRFQPRDQTFRMLAGFLVGVNFSGSAAPLQTISGRITHPDGTTGVSGVSIGLSGAQTSSKVTDANGNFSFTGVLEGGNYIVTPSNANFTFSPTNRSFNNVTEPQTANFTASFVLQLILDDLGQVAAVDSVLRLRDPFPVINNANVFNSGVDRNTRVAIFLSNFQLGPTEPPSSVVINLVGSNSQSYDIPAEDVRPLPDGFTRVTFRLPDTLTVGTCTLLVKARGLTSNIGALRIRN